MISKQPKLRSLFLLAFLLCCGLLQINAQEKTLQKANNAFSKGEYYTAALFYEALLKDTGKLVNKNFNPYNNKLLKQKQASLSESVRKTVTVKAAESFYLHNNFTKAEVYYQEAIVKQLNTDVAVKLNYAKSLRANNKLDLAESQLQSIVSDKLATATQVQKAKAELANIQFYKEQQVQARVSIAKLPETAKLPNASYAPVAQGSRVFFTGTSFDSASFKKEQNPFRNVVYQLNTNTGIIDSVSITNIEGVTHKAAISFTPDGNTAFFSGWSLSDSGIKKSAIYTIKKQGDSWGQPQLAAAVNLTGYSSQQPQVSTDGKYLYFSSNMPGGNGGFDIWISALDGSSQPQTPANAGTTINTVDDEQAPFFHSKSNVLYFASNGRVGFGGFDLYQSKKTGDAWQQPVNLGKPINSLKDDIYFNSASSFHAQKEALISSDRESDCCLELFKVKTAQGKRFLKGMVVDCETNAPLEASMVILHQGNIKKGDTLFTNANGGYQFSLKENTVYQLNVSKPTNYSEVNLTIPANITDSIFADTITYPDICLQKNKLIDTLPNTEVVDVLKGKPLGINFDFDKSDLLPKSIIALDFFASVLTNQPEINMEIGGHTDSYGNEEYNRKLGERRSKACFDYLVKKGIDPKRLKIVSYGKCCPLVPETIDGKDNPEARFKNRRVECKLLN